ncbi:MAG: MerR family transcriptional regulator [Burkholderiales bacterium]|jgi:DNA-binding transcriptional MerR regulator|nr:MerR family transcriptional regulator [Burkholderiales bacterium]MBP7519927.1 MerR family transcriptional regulator [Leptothrix sp. (in: b-proteobacteria)]HQY07471.1 MerR family transcriptional regulator [Burkholderiaceae bacterium]
MENSLPAIPPKRYFTIGEVSELCGVKPYVLRYWEQEFTQLRPMKRRGNRRYYQHHEVLLIRRIRDLLYEQGFTISGARNRLSEQGAAVWPGHGSDEPGGAVGLLAVVADPEEADEMPQPFTLAALEGDVGGGSEATHGLAHPAEQTPEESSRWEPAQLRRELQLIRALLESDD